MPRSGVYEQAEEHPAPRSRHSGPDFENIDVFELSVLGMVVTDTSGRFRRVNAAFADLIGRSKRALIGTTFSSLTGPDDVASSAAVMRDLLGKAVDTASFDKHYLRPDGTLVSVGLHIRALTDLDGEVVGFLTQAVDIGARERAESMVEAERQRLEEAQGVAGVGSFEQDATTLAIRPSRELCRLLGMPVVSEFDIATLLERVHPDDRGALIIALQSCAEAGTPVSLAHRLVRPDGTTRWVEARATRAFAADGQPRVLGTALDITARKKAEDDLEFQTFNDP